MLGVIWGRMEAKQAVRNLLEKLPDDCTLEDVPYHLYVLQRVSQGLAETDAGDLIPHEQAEEELRRRWLVSWAEFERAAPDFAAAGRRLLVGSDGGAIGFLATVGRRGAPHMAPVCPIFCDDHLYLSAGIATPKVRDLRNDGAFALHAFLGQNDEEFQIAGSAAEVTDPAERGAVHDAIPFAAFNRADPIFRLVIERALWVYWERVGRPDTKAIRRRWPSR